MLSRDSLKLPFSASHYVQTTESVILPTNLTTRAQWVVSRSLCLFKCFDVNGLPTKNKSEALEVLVRRWVPFEHVGYHVIFTSQFAVVWAWDKSQVESSVEELGVQLVSVLPESVYYSERDGTGSRWIKSQDKGYIFQLWADGVLIIEKWFATLPSTSKFDLFTRALEIPSNIELSWEQLSEICHSAQDIGSQSLLQSPWGAKNKNLSIVQNLPWEITSIIAVTFCLVLSYVWTISSSFSIYASLNEVNDRVNKIEKSVEPVLTARISAESENRRLKELITLFDYPSQSNVIADVSDILLSFELILKEWEFQGARIELITEGKVNTLNLVKKFEELSWVESVSVSGQRQQNQNKFALELKVVE